MTDFWVLIAVPGTAAVSSAVTWGPRESFGAELRAVVADAWRGTNTHATTAALRATRAGRLALGAVHLGRRLICADLALMSRSARDELVAEARRRDLIRSWR